MLSESLKHISGLDENRWLRRYFNFLEFSLKTEKEGQIEKHHILPRKVFPEFEKEKWNLIPLTLREHFIAHYILAKAFGGNMWFAFNFMTNRTSHKNSRIYELGRIEFINILKKQVISEETRQKISDSTKGCLVVKDSDGNTFRCSSKDERYLSGELVSYRVGFIHSQETIDKMIENSGLIGKNAYFNSDGLIKYFKDEPDLKIWTKGNPLIGDKDYLHDRLWVTLFDGKTVRITIEEILKRLDIKTIGRIFENKGFKLINEGGFKKCFNLLTWKYEFVEKEKFEETDTLVDHGWTPSKILLFGYKQFIFSSYSKFEIFLKQRGIFCPSKKDLKDDKIIKYHFNMKNMDNMDFTTPVSKLGYFIIDSSNFQKINHKDYIINPKGNR